MSGSAKRHKYGIPPFILDARDIIQDKWLTFRHYYRDALTNALWCLLVLVCITGVGYLLVAASAPPIR